MPDPKLLWFHSTERKSVYVKMAKELGGLGLNPRRLV
jgi:hypothetical protein